MTYVLSAQDESSILLDNFVKSKGERTISFDAGNIKQFWIDNSVIARDNFIEIFLSKDSTCQSIPLNLRLINVDETQDCKIEVVTDSPNARFTVVDDKKNVLSESKREDDFIQYHVLSSIIHLEETKKQSFNLVFSRC